MERNGMSDALEFGEYDVQLGDTDYWARCKDVSWREVDAALKSSDAAEFVMTRVVQWLWHAERPNERIDHSDISARTYRKIHRAIISDFQNLS